VIYTAGQRFASLVAANPAQFTENRFAVKWTYSWSPWRVVSPWLSPTSRGTAKQSSASF